MKKIRISSGSPFEKPIGFSRALRSGNRILVSGTAPISENGTTSYPGDVYRQTQRCLEIIKKAIPETGGTLEDVVRTTWKEAGRVHGEYFGTIQPASTFIEVSGLIDPEWMVEIEAECEIPD